MSLTQAILLAAVQGLTELLPVSSSGHLFAISWLLGWPDQGLAFDIALHLGTLGAVLIYFFRDWAQVIAQGFGLDYQPDPELAGNPRLLWMLAAATVPVGVAGLIWKETAETTLRTPWVVGSMLILVGLLMAHAERRGTRNKGIGEVSMLDALMIGLAQCLAILPGTSRSGITMTAALFRGLDRPTAARFSFLLSTPAVAAAGLKALYDGIREAGLAAILQPELAVGIFVSGAVGWLVIAFLMRFLARHGLAPFILYRIGFGILIIALAFRRS